MRGNYEKTADGQLRGIIQAYIDYLTKNKVQSNYYIQYSFKFGQPPCKYGNPEEVMKKSMSEYSQDIPLEKNALNVKFSYIIALSNVMAIGTMRGWFGEEHIENDYIVDLMVNGVLHAENQCE